MAISITRSKISLFFLFEKSPIKSFRAANQSDRIFRAQKVDFLRKSLESFDPVGKHVFFGLPFFRQHEEIRQKLLPEM